MIGSAFKENFFFFFNVKTLQSQEPIQITFSKLQFESLKKLSFSAPGHHLAFQNKYRFNFALLNKSLSTVNA